jgi:hypothetical protein
MNMMKINNGNVRIIYFGDNYWSIDIENGRWIEGHWEIGKTGAGIGCRGSRGC